MLKFAGELRMDARNPMLRTVAILVIMVGWSFPVYADLVYTYGGDFTLPIPKPDSNDPYISEGWMDDAIIEVGVHHIIHDIDVGINLTHTNVFDLQIFLQSPSSARICLNMYDFQDEFFEGENYIQTIFDDEALIPIELAEAPFTGRFRPLDPYRLSAFDYENSFGLWCLQIYDAFYADTGTLNRFELMITTPEPATMILLILGAGLMTLSKPHR